MDNTLEEIIDDINLNALIRYYKRLSNYGYSNKDSVTKLLFLSFINDLLNNFQYYITDCDYRSIVSSVYCIIGTDCLFPFKVFDTTDKLYKTNSSLIFRNIESELHRISEDNLARVYQNSDYIRESRNYKFKRDSVMAVPCE